MSVKFIGPLAILGAAGLLIAACGAEPEVDVGSNSEAPAVVEHREGWPLTADGAIRRELAKLEAHRAGRPTVVEDWGGWPVSANGAIRRELAELEAHRAGD